MRRIFPLVLMLLLVLRGLVGTAMAAGMVTAPPLLPGIGTTVTGAALVHSAHPAPAADRGAAADHGQHAHLQCAGAASGACGSTSSDHAHSPLCSACEICHSALLAPPRLDTLAHGAAAGQLQAGTSARFASAAAALAIKPPIA